MSRNVTKLHVHDGNYLRCTFFAVSANKNIHYNFVINLIGGLDKIIVQSVWYYDLIPAVMDGCQLVFYCEQLFKRHWELLSDRAFIKICKNEINTKYLRKVRHRDAIRGRIFLPPLISNGGADLTSKIKRLEHEKARTPRPAKREYEFVIGDWETFDFKLS